MGITHEYPLDASITITLPEQWLGDHLIRYEQATKAADLAQGAMPPEVMSGMPTPGIISDFVVALCILDDWTIPNMPANMRAWRVDKVPLQVMLWVRHTTMTSFKEALVVPKNSSAPS